MKINLDVTPSEALGGATVIRSKEDMLALEAKINSMVGVRSFFIDCWNCQAAVALRIFSQNGSSHVERFSEDEMAQMGVTNDMLREAVESSGGALNRSGHYPINEEIKEALIWWKAARAEDKDPWRCTLPCLDEEIIE